MSEVQLSAGLVLGAACKPLTPRLGPVKHTQTRGAGKAAELPEALQCLDRTVPGQSQATPHCASYFSPLSLTFHCPVVPGSQQSKEDVTWPDAFVICLL